MSRADRNQNRAYILQEYERVSRTPETFLSRWYSKAVYDSNVGLKDEVTTNVKYLVKLFHRQRGKCAICGNKMGHSKGEGRKDCNISVARKNWSKSFNSWNIELLCTKIHHDRLWRKNLFYLKGLKPKIN